MNLEDLKHIAVLRALDEAALTGLTGALEQRDCADGQTVFAEGDPGDAMFFIRAGTVRIEKQTGADASSRKTLAVLEAGDYFGEMTLITGFPRTATVRTVTACTCISIERGQFSRLMDRYPELRRELSEVAVQRLRQSSLAVAESRR